MSQALIPDPQYIAQQNARQTLEEATKQYNQYIKTTPLTDLNSLQKVTRTQPQPQQQIIKTYMDAKDFKMENFKTPVHELLDSLFTLEEMTEYLLTMDYHKLSGSSYFVKGDPDPEFKRTFTVQEAFYSEMTIKLKNTLLAKGTLKLKI
jgi:hypothetical protein